MVATAPTEKSSSAKFVIVNFLQNKDAIYIPKQNIQKKSMKVTNAKFAKSLLEMQK